MSISFYQLHKGVNLKENNLLKIRNTIEEADAILVFAGAGMSTDLNFGSKENSMTYIPSVLLLGNILNVYVRTEER